MSNTSKNQAFLLKGGAYTLTSLQLMTLDLAHLTQALASKVNEAPKFFEKTPLVLDLQKIPADTADINLTEILACLRQHRLIPVGVRGANETVQQAALAQGLACFPDGKSHDAKTENATQTLETSKIQQNNVAHSPTKIITQPVRSGQQVYASGGDLIVLATVSHGAEILADGNIHIYAPLRGRALAGVLGDTNTYIFCQSLEAELVSVAGQYRISEQLKETSWQKPVQISLSEGHLRIAPLWI